jgi:alkyl hydroperoxide reductase subunit AhpF
MSDSGFRTPSPGNGPTHRSGRWTIEEVLEQVTWSGEDAEAVARAVIDWAVSHSRVRINGGKAKIDRALTMYAGSGQGKGVPSLFAAENGGGPMLELRIEQICSMPPYDRDEARVQLTAHLRALGIPRLDAEDIPTAIRTNIPWTS